MSLPYKFNTEVFINGPCGSNMPMPYVSTSVNSFQYTSDQGSKTVYSYKSTIDAYYKTQNSNNPSVYQYKSDQERMAALMGRLKVSRC